MKTMTVTATLLATALAVGCSSSTSKEPVADAGTSGTATPAPADPAGDPAGDPAAAPPPAPALKAPTIDGIAKMGGALHVSWTNAEPTAAEVTLERKTATVAYKVIATLPGDSDNMHDVDATEATSYTYRVRCKKGAAYSPYSNEMSARPK